VQWFFSRQTRHINRPVLPRHQFACPTVSIVVIWRMVIAPQQSTPSASLWSSTTSRGAWRVVWRCRCGSAAGACVCRWCHAQAARSRRRSMRRPVTIQKGAGVKRRRMAAAGTPIVCAGGRCRNRQRRGHRAYTGEARMARRRWCVSIWRCAAAGGAAVCSMR